MEQTLGKRIMQHRKQLGMTQDQLAERLGVTAQAVSKWENDQSCPDISILGTLADIFGISTDALLGRVREPVYEAELVKDEEDEDDEKADSGWEFHYDAGRRGALSVAVLVLAVGAQLFLANMLNTDISFWSALWPTALAVFGLFGLFQSFSFLNVGCLLFGGYFLLDNWGLLPFTLGANLVFPTVLVIFGLSLLADALKKPRKSSFHFHTKGKNSKQKNDYRIEGEQLDFTASFGELTQDVSMDRLSRGRITTSFGDFCVDLSEVEEVSEDCQLQAVCSFGELTLRVPRKFAVKQSATTAFGEVSVSGHPDAQPQGVIHLKANASFGEITVQYI